MESKLLTNAEWSEETFGHCDFGEKRLTKRLVQMSTDLASSAGSSLASSCDGDNTKITAGYRFLRNEKATPEKVMQGVVLSTAAKARASSSGDLLALEDTTSLSYKHSVREELGYLSNSDSRSKGIWVHTALLIEGDGGSVLGIAEQSRWVRAETGYGKKHRRSNRDYKEKESFKWEACSRNLAKTLSSELDRVISVCDREADIFGYLSYKVSENQRFIVRAGQDRLLSDEGGVRISESVMSTEELGRYQFIVEQRGGRKSRKADVSLRSERVALQVPAKLQSTFCAGSLEVTVVIATEESVKAGDRGLSWVLLTSEACDSYEQALKVVKSYERRWLIEEFHKCWKSGLGVEELRMQSASTLETMAVILAPIAVRLMQLKAEMSEDKGSASSCLEALSLDEFIVLWRSTEKKKELPAKKPSLNWAYRAIAKLGGWSDSKRTGKAGWLALWKGWVRLADRVEGYAFAK